MSDRRLPPPTMAQLLARPAPAAPTWSDFAPLVDKCAALIQLNKNTEEAKAFATSYSVPRRDDEVLAMFCDGSGSPLIPAGVAQARSGGKPCKIKFQNRKWTSSGVAFKKNASDTRWVKLGFPTEDLWSNVNAELDAFGRVATLAEERLLVDLTIEKIFCFSDSMSILQGILGMSLTRKLPNWDLPLLLKVMKALVRLSEKPDMAVELFWVPSYCGVPGNEEADKAAASARPDLLWLEKYPTVTGSKNRSKKVGYIPAATTTTTTTTTMTTTTIITPERSGPAAKYMNQRREIKMEKYRKKRDADLALSDELFRNY